MSRKQVHLIVNAEHALLRTPSLDNRIWFSAQRLVNRCRRGLVKQISVTDREPSMKFDAPLIGRVF
jgi:hypothetical protein